MKTIMEYMQQSRDERRAHLKLNEACDERGLRYSYNLIALLAWLLDTTFPQKGDKVIVCHACHNSKCSNPNHLYWGTYKDNHDDQVEAGTHASIYERTMKKYGTNKHKEILSASGSKGGTALKGIAKTDEHKQKISKALIKNAS